MPVFERSWLSCYHKQLLLLFVCELSCPAVRRACSCVAAGVACMCVKGHLLALLILYWVNILGVDNSPAWQDDAVLVTVNTLPCACMLAFLAMN